MKRKKRLLAILLTVALGATPVVSYAAEGIESDAAAENTVEEDLIQPYSESENGESDTDVVDADEMDVAAYDANDFAEEDVLPKTIAWDDPSQFTMTYVRSGGGQTAFGINLWDEDGSQIDGTLASTRETVSMPYTINIDDFVDSNVDVDGTFLYATITDPNYGDDEHEFDDDSNVGKQEVYGSEDNPVVSITLDSVAADSSKGQVSRTWVYELNFKDDSSYTISIYGNQNGGNDTGGLYCPRDLELNLYFGDRPAFAVYSAEDESLIFYTDSSVPEEGSTYKDRDVTDVYTGFDTIQYTEETDVPWHDISSDVKSVSFDESFADVEPIATACWFSGFTTCTEIDLTNLDTSEVTTMYRMFYYCYVVSELDVSEFDTSKVTSMQGMFNSCQTITELDVSGFDTSKVTNMHAMFYNCSALTTIYSDDSMFVTTAVTDGGDMFAGCRSLVGGNGYEWDGGNITFAMAHVDTADNPGYFTDGSLYDDSFYDGVIFAPSNKTANRQAANGGGRTAMTGLRQFADENGKLEIILPTNSDLGSTFTIYRDDKGDEYTSSAALQRINGNYNWKLVGWYNIANGEYYSVEDGKEVTAEIDLHESNVFYADYISASYDFGSSSDDALVDTISTADFVDIKMFDYNELFNLYSSDLSVTESGDTEAAFTNSTFDETWSDGKKFYDTPNYTGLSRDENTALANSFIYLGSANGSGTLLNPASYATWNQSTTTIHSASNWGIDSPSLDNPILGSLFDPYSDRLGVTYVGQSDFLFQYGTEEEEGSDTDPDNDKYVGYYYYDSGLNSVAYNQSEQRFYVYDRLEYYSDLTMFLPYNYFTDGASSHSDSEIDYWFGMNMEIQFYLPYAVGTEADPSDNTFEGNDMEFNFSGDDDIMVFVDDKLVLDMAGVHTEADGSINFAKGTATTFVWANNNHTGYGQEPKTTTFELDAGDHTMTVYYLERGRSASNLAVSFNILPDWQYESDSVTTVAASKEWADGNENHAEDSVRMGLFEEVSDFERGGDDSFIIDGTTYTYRTDETYTAANGQRYTYNAFYFSDSGGIAWYDKDANKLYLLVSDPPGESNPVDLSSSNGWNYVWELLDEEKEYITREMTRSSTYAASYSVSKGDSDAYQYWSIIGETELEEAVRGNEENPSSVTMDVILTDAAQATAEEGTLLGIVMSHALQSYNNIVFSMHAVKDAENSNLYKYGIVNNSQITDDMVWTLTYTDDKGSDIYGSTELHTFTLSYESDGVRYYLILDESSSGLTVTTVSSEAAEFYCDNAGELRVYSSGGIGVSKKRVVISDNGTLSIEDTSNDLQENNLHIYTLSSGHTDVYTWEVVNRSVIELPNMGGSGITRISFLGLAVILGGAVCVGVTLYRRRGRYV